MQLLAIKKCKWDITQLTETQRNRWINEVEIMKRLRHRNIIKALELPFKHPDEKVDLPILCMEFCRKGDLRKVNMKLNTFLDKKSKYYSHIFIVFWGS